MTWWCVYKCDQVLEFALSLCLSADLFDWPLCLFVKHIMWNMSTVILQCFKATITLLTLLHVRVWCQNYWQKPCIKCELKHFELSFTSHLLLKLHIVSLMMLDTQAERFWSFLNNSLWPSWNWSSQSSFSSHCYFTHTNTNYCYLWIFTSFLKKNDISKNLK